MSQILMPINHGMIDVTSSMYILECNIWSRVSGPGIVPIKAQYGDSDVGDLKSDNFFMLVTEFRP